MKIIGRDREVAQIEECIGVMEAGMHIGEGPLGVFMLAGPSGSGKTRTVEALAAKWHGSPKHMLKVDCGEFQLEHEVARLIGAPPGYLGHRETTPLLTQAKLAACTSEKCGVSFVLFDEIEKAAPSMQRLLLGVMDKGTLKLGDNTSVNFEKSIIFFTSNLGTKGLFKKNMFEIAPNERRDVKESVVRAAIKAYFPIEFMNRVTAVFVYRQLTEAEAMEVARYELDRYMHEAGRRFENVKFGYDGDLVRVVFEKGFSREFGGRELKRTIYRSVVVPLASWVRNRGARLEDREVFLTWNGALEISETERDRPAAKAAVVKGRR